MHARIRGRVLFIAPADTPHSRAVVEPCRGILERIMNGRAVSFGAVNVRDVKYVLLPSQLKQQIRKRDDARERDRGPLAFLRPGACALAELPPFRCSLQLSAPS